MAGRSGWVAHVMQAVEAGDEIVVFARKGLGWSDIEVHAIRDPRVLRFLACGCDRGVVVIEAEELRLGIGLRHQQRRRAVPASHIGNTSSGLELRLDAVESWNPVRREVRQIAGPEEALASVEQARLVLVPTE